jgi:hypothetical protein
MSSLAPKVLVTVILRNSRWQDLALDSALCPLRESCALLFDNGGAELPGPSLPWRLVRDGSNPGVGPRYAQAALVAKECGLPFLLLLDQDFAPPQGWWAAYEAAVRRCPGATAWAPRLLTDSVQLSPFRVRRGLPCGPSPAGKQLPALSHVALNSGLLVRTDSVLAAAGFLELCPLDFSDFALCRSMGLAGGSIAPVDLDLVHSSSTHEPATAQDRLRRFCWFAHGARGWRRILSNHRLRIGTWVLGRALRLSVRHRDPRFLAAAAVRYLGNRLP